MCAHAPIASRAEVCGPWGQTLGEEAQLSVDSRSLTWGQSLRHSEPQCPRHTTSTPWTVLSSGFWMAEPGTSSTPVSLGGVGPDWGLGFSAGA